MWRECWRTCVVLISVWLETIWMFCRDEKRLWWTHNMAAGRRAVLSLQRRWTVSESTEKLSVSSSPPQIIEVLINCEWVATLISVGLKVSYPMVGMVVRGRIDPHRPAALHLIGLVSFLSLAFLFSLFCLPSSTLTSPHLSSPLFLLSRPARAPHINRLRLIRCKCEIHKKKRALAKIRSLVCKQLSTTVQGRTGRTGRSRWCNMRLHKSPGDPRQIQRNEHKPRAALHTVTQDKLR